MLFLFEGLGKEELLTPETESEAGGRFTRKRPSLKPDLSIVAKMSGNGLVHYPRVR